ncbi:MAG: hypothetical protein QNJ55_17415 [Xenococcus sp. MO_188.B8]|nr:hypothetical protein [Xenococcus sp. MO_188.B8]
MVHTIDTQTAIKKFLNFIDIKSKYRVLGLTGDSKMGKSHLATKVFPQECKTFNMCPIAVDLEHLKRSNDIIECILFQLENNEIYFADSSKIELSKIVAVNAQITVNARSESINDKEAAGLWIHRFTRNLRKVTNKRILLIFDSVNKASEETQTWLKTFLSMVARLSSPDIRIVIVGQQLPILPSTIDLLYTELKLKQVLDEKEYITYCRDCNLNLVEQSIKDFAHACEYKPGFFAELMRAFS